MLGFSQAFDTPPTWSFTFFAPSDAAFGQHTGSYFATNYGTAKGKHWFGNILQHHYIPNSKLPLSTFNGTVQRLQMGSYLYASVQEEEGSVVLNSQSHVVEGDLQVTNGVVHIIDHILDPSTMIYEADIPKVQQAFIAGSCSNPALPYC